MLGALGDVILDVVVRVGGPIRPATDTSSTIVHRRGGSAANVAAGAARVSGASRFIGQYGADAIGGWLRSSLLDAGVDCVGRIGGRSGTVVALVDPSAERSMLTDRGDADHLSDPDPAWVDGLGTLHVPLYSFAGGALADSAHRLVGWAREAGSAISIDASSVSLIDSLGRVEVRRLLDRLAPDLVFLNEDEAAALGTDLPGVVVVKHGPRPAVVFERGRVHTVPVPPGPLVTDTTGAGDAFAAGYLVAALDGAEPAEAASAGHRSAAVAMAAAAATLAEADG